jgi:hypothetical protein
MLASGGSRRFAMAPDACYEKSLRDYGTLAAGLVAAFEAFDDLDGARDGAFVEKATDDIYAETNVDLCALVDTFVAMNRKSGEPTAARIGQTANAFLSFANLVRAKNAEHRFAVRGELVNMQLGFAMFLGDALGFDDGRWIQATALPGGKYSFWGPAVEGVLPEGRWKLTAWERTVPPRRLVENEGRCGDFR